MIYLPIGCWIFAAYIVGGVSSGYYIMYYLFGVDITQKGSRNKGATNVARVSGNIFLFFLVLALDACKAWAIIYLPFIWWMNKVFTPHILIPVAAATLLGNCYSILAHFGGSKGVSTFLGILCAVTPVPVPGLFVAIWLIMFGMFRQAYIAGLSASCSAAFLYLMFAPQPHVDLFVFLCISFLVILHRHKNNINRVGHI